jgi:hypothetical protein
VRTLLIFRSPPGLEGSGVGEGSGTLGGGRGGGGGGQGCALEGREPLDGVIVQHEVVLAHGLPLGGVEDEVGAALHLLVLLLRLHSLDGCQPHLRRRAHHTSGPHTSVSRSCEVSILGC